MIFSEWEILLRLFFRLEHQKIKKNAFNHDTPVCPSACLSYVAKMSTADAYVFLVDWHRFQNLKVGNLKFIIDVDLKVDNTFTKFI